MPYESTDATLRTLVPAGPKYLFASPQFWTTFHAEPETTFYLVCGGPARRLAGATALCRRVDIDRPIFLIVDELQWLPELSSSISQSHHQLAAGLDCVHRTPLRPRRNGARAPHTARWRCTGARLPGSPPAGPTASSAGTSRMQLGARALSQTTEDLASWPRYDDPRRTPAGRPQVRPGPQGLEISGTGWPGIVKMFNATPGERYLVRA